LRTKKIAATLNERFVSIKVDRGEGLDVNEIYMRAVLIFTNGHSVWPMSVFLTPNGKLFFGGTYFPFAEDACGKLGEVNGHERRRTLGEVGQVPSEIA